jgi:hypothetical protein
MSDFFGFVHEVIAWPFIAIHEVLGWLWGFLFGWI